MEREIMNSHDRLVEYFGPFYKKIAIGVVDLLSATKVNKSIRLINKLAKKSNDEIKEWQFSQLASLVNHFYKNSKYYNKLLNDKKVHPSDLRHLNDISILPIITKQDLLANNKILLPENLKSYKYLNNATGGSTGDPLKYLIDFDSLSFNLAYSIESWEKYGWHYGQNHIAFGSSSLKVESNVKSTTKIFNLIRGRIPLNGVNLSESVLKRYVGLINDRKIKFIYGYASALFLLAQYCLTQHIGVHIDTCFSTSEMLIPHYRTTIQKAFNCKVVDCYGARDGGIMAYQNDNGTYKVSYGCYIETENSKIPSPVLTTDLFNRCFPFIRYSVGDSVLLSGNKYENYNGQIISKILGRTSEIMYLENGRVLTGPGFTVLFNDLPVVGYQIKKEGVNFIRCYVIKKSDFTDFHYQLILSTISKHAGSDCKVELVFVDSIQYSASGKSQYFLV